MSTQNICYFKEYQKAFYINNNQYAPQVALCSYSFKVRPYYEDIFSCYFERFTSDDHDKANSLNDFFSDQTIIGETNAVLPQMDPYAVLKYELFGLHFCWNIFSP